jgi:hypothetical protein
VLDSENLPAHLMLSGGALRLVGQARAESDAGTARWQKLSISTDYPDGQAVEIVP